MWVICTHSLSSPFPFFPPLSPSPSLLVPVSLPHGSLLLVLFCLCFAVKNEERKLIKLWYHSEGYRDNFVSSVHHLPLGEVIVDTMHEVLVLWVWIYKTTGLKWVIYKGCIFSQTDHKHCVVRSLSPDSRWMWLLKLKRSNRVGVAIINE